MPTFDNFTLVKSSGFSANTHLKMEIQESFFHCLLFLLEKNILYRI